MMYDETIVNEFQKKPLRIKAIRLLSNNLSFVFDFCPVLKRIIDKEGFIIPTLEGDHEGYMGDWIIQGIKGEFYFIKDEIFIASYLWIEPKEIVNE